MSILHDKPMKLFAMSPYDLDGIVTNFALVLVTPRCAKFVYKSVIPSFKYKSCGVPSDRSCRCSRIQCSKGEIQSLHLPKTADRKSMQDV